ncbi:MAG: type II toxin-antitoxin system RelE/ParE family toxin [Nitrospirae bacterium]|nr:type II toxin-antitoxin system RelE/ParE family toxin [Nitrospirota bacterium]
MNIIRTDPFKKDFKRLPKEIKRKTEQSLRFLIENIQHPSLRVKKMEGVRDIWEASVTMQYRFTFEIREDDIILRRIGTHDILKRP